MIKLASPKYFLALAERITPWLWGFFTVLMVCGLVDGLFIAPADYQQGDAYRIMFIHVPAAIMSLGIYMVVAFSAAIYFIWHIKLADLVAKVSVPIGASMTAIALVTGAIWGKPMWGTFWIWDARLTSELILLFLYVGLIILRRSFEDNERAARACGILTLVGVVDIPIIHYSVYWWNTLHQKSTLLNWHGPSIALSMLWPLLIMIAAFTIYTAALLFQRMMYELKVRGD